MLYVYLFGVTDLVPSVMGPEQMETEERYVEIENFICSLRHIFAQSLLNILHGINWIGTRSTIILINTLGTVYYLTINLISTIKAF